MSKKFVHLSFTQDSDETNGGVPSNIRYKSRFHIWLSAISLGLSIFQSGYAITVISTLKTQIQSNFGWNIQSTSTQLINKK